MCVCVCVCACVYCRDDCKLFPFPIFHLNIEVFLNNTSWSINVSRVCRWPTDVV